MNWIVLLNMIHVLLSLQLLEKEQAKSQSALEDYKAVCAQLKARDEQIAAFQSQMAESEKVSRQDSQKKDKQIQQLTKTQKVYMNSVV